MLHQRVQVADKLQPREYHKGIRPVGGQRQHLPGDGVVEWIYFAGRAEGAPAGGGQSVQRGQGEGHLSEVGLDRERIRGRRELGFVGLDLDCVGLDVDFGVW